MEFIPSEYQRALFEWMRDGKGHGICMAVAGSGKSKSIEVGFNEYLVPSRDDFTGELKRAIVVAFNSHIATAMSVPGKLPKFAEAATLNAFFWRICRANIRGLQLNKHKNFLILKSIVDQYNEKERFGRIRAGILRMVSLLKALNQDTIDNWQEIQKLYGVELASIKKEDLFEEVLARVWKHSAHEAVQYADFDYDDQIYQAIKQGWQIPKYFFIAVDEGQDLSPIQIVGMERAAEQGGRLLVVGDPDQNIYMFRGSEIDAMDKIKEKFSCTELPLSICYRCPDLVIESAREQVPRIEAPNPNTNGRGILEWKSTEDFLREVKDGDFCLCRTVAPLIKRCLQLLSMGKRSYVRGRELVDQVILLVEQIHENPIELEREVCTFRQSKRIPLNGQSHLDAFITKLNEYRTRQVSALESQGRETEAQMLDDRCMGVLSFTEKARFVGEIIILVEDITSDEAQEGIALLTGHKSKGLENPVVWILRPDLIPHPKAKTPLAQKQEKNLLYIMKTRARKELYFVQKERDEK